VSDKPIIILVTVGNQPEAKAIARRLIEQRLAACVGIQRQQSIYRWEGKIMEEGEFLLIIKTTRDQFNSVQAAVLAAHSYDVPEIISMDISMGYAGYLDWIAESVAR
jgi:periplasmic divalent cation tolerance protein